jgi:hypothetical protein
MLIYHFFQGLVEFAEHRFSKRGVDAAPFRIVTKVSHEQSPLDAPDVRYGSSDALHHVLSHGLIKCDPAVRTPGSHLCLDFVNAVPQHTPEVTQAIQDAQVVPGRKSFPIRAYGIKSLQQLFNGLHPEVHGFERVPREVEADLEAAPIQGEDLQGAAL